MSQEESPAVELSQAAVKESASARWGRLMERQRGSGLSVSAFCREHGLSPSSWFAWRRRLKASDEDVGGGGGGATMFKPVKVVAGSIVGGSIVGGGGETRSARDDGSDPSIESRLVGIEVCLRGGHHLIVRRGFDAQLLLDVARTMESRRAGTMESLT